MPARTVPLRSLPLSQVLAEDVVSDLDSPPFDKAMMDGYALRGADLVDGRGELAVVEEVPAGKVPTRSVGLGEATRIMTGAPIPEGADAVVMVERTRPLADGRVAFEDAAFRPGQNVLRRGLEMTRGERILTPGTLLRPQELGLLASVGHTEVRVIPRPRLAVLTTGDEIVEPEDLPPVGSIRNSNQIMLLAQAQRAGAEAVSLGIARDDRTSLAPRIDQGLEADVLVLSGGVSAGNRDLVPGALETAGVEAVFHKVAMKPGKPLFFGIRPRSEGPPTLVFGLPGNPVSSLVGFELFVRPALRALMGLASGPFPVAAALADDFPYRTDRTTYHPAVLTRTPLGWSVRPVPWFGSPDLRGVTPGNALLILPAGHQVHAAGTVFDVLVSDDLLQG